jgi:hypothetical protein
MEEKEQKRSSPYEDKVAGENQSVGRMSPVAALCDTYGYRHRRQLGYFITFPHSARHSLVLSLFFLHPLYFSCCLCQIARYYLCVT